VGIFDDWDAEAAAGSVVAQAALGCALVWGAKIGGETLEPDYVRALAYLQKAADAGASRAIYYLGVLYEDGLGIPEDLPRAVALFERAADADEYGAILHLARLYADGRLGYRDSDCARFWYERLLELAAEVEQGSSEADVDAGLDVDADGGEELAEAKMFIASGRLAPTAKRARGRP
jgi:TPR repeat protein